MGMTPVRVFTYVAIASVALMPMAVMDAATEPPLMPPNWVVW